MSKKHKLQNNSVIPADRIFYWAYGSNLCERQMKRRCPAAIKYGPMSVRDCALVFRHVADVTVRDGAVTPGGLWQITAACERELDIFEGVSQRNYLKRYFRISIEGKFYTCLFYQMRTKEGVMPPPEKYLSTIVEGYKDFGLDLDLLDMYLQESWGNKRITDDLADRHWRKGNPKLARALDLPTAAPERDAHGLPLPMWTEGN